MALLVAIHTKKTALSRRYISVFAAVKKLIQNTLKDIFVRLHGTGISICPATAAQDMIELA